MDRRHLWIRSPRQQAILRVRHEVISAVRDFFNERGFILADTPIFTPAACEGTTTLFPVQYFDDETAYLTQSGQLYNEANAMALGRVYCFGPTFRAEKSKTRRHLTEFWMVEPEMAYATLDDVMDLAEALVVYVVQRVARTPPAGAEGARARHVEAREREGAVPARLVRRSGEDPQGEGAAVRVGRRLRRARRDGAVREVRPAGLRAPLSVGGEGVLHEAGSRSGPRSRCAWTCSRPRATARSSAAASASTTTICCVPRIKEHKLPQEAFEWYLDLRRFGSVPHGGFGMGIERVVSWICGIEHLREAIPYPRCCTGYIRRRRMSAVGCHRISARHSASTSLDIQHSTFNIQQ